MQPRGTSGIITAIDAVSRRADELARIELAQVDGVRAGDALLRRALTDAEHAADQLASGTWGEQPARSARLAVRMLEHGVMDQVALRDLGMRVGKVFTEVRQAVARRMEDADRPAQLQAMLNRDPDSLTPQEWSRLAAILRTQSQDGTLVLTHELVGVRPLAEIAARNADATSAGSRYPEVAFYWDRARVDQLDPAARQTQQAALLGRAHDDLGQGDWLRLSTLLGSDPLQLPDIDGLPKFQSLARQRALGYSTAENHLELYTHRFAVERMDDAARDAEIATLLDVLRSDGRLDTTQAHRLSTHLDLDDGTRILAPAEIDGLEPLSQLLRGGHAGPEQAAQLHHYGERDLVARMSRAERATQAEALLGGGSYFGRSDARRLAALLDDDVDESLVHAPRQIAGLEHSFARLLRARADGVAVSDPRLEAYVDAVAARRVPPAQRTAELHRLLTKPSPHTQWEVRRLGALLVSEADPGILQLTSTLPDRNSLVHVAHEALTKPYSLTQVARYMDRAAAAQLPHAERAAVVDGLLARDPGVLKTDDWMRLRSVLDGDPSGSLTGAGIDAARLQQLVNIRANGGSDGYVERELQALFATHVVSKLSNEQRRDAALESIDALQQGYDPTRNAGRLRALMGMDADGSIVPLPRQLRLASDLEHVLERTTAGDRRSPDLDRYLSLASVMQEAPAARAAEANALMARGAMDLSKSDWARLSALLDADVGGAMVDIPRHIPPFRDLAEVARGIAVYDAPVDGMAGSYFHAWRTRNDPAQLQRLEEAIARIGAGQVDEADRARVADEWYRLADLVDGRPLHVQTAIASIVMDMDHVAGSRSVQESLELARTNLAKQKPLDEQLEALRSETIELLDLNLARLAGHTPTGAVRGWSNHPDYGEVGRIRVNLQLLNRVHSLDEANPGLNALDQARTGAEQVAW